MVAAVRAKAEALAYLEEKRSGTVLFRAAECSIVLAGVITASLLPVGRLCVSDRRDGCGALAGVTVAGVRGGLVRGGGLGTEFGVPGELGGYDGVALLAGFVDGGFPAFVLEPSVHGDVVGQVLDDVNF